MANRVTTFPPLLLLVSGPAGSGKTTVCSGILDAFSHSRRYSQGMRRVITATTRPPRDNEQNGRDYFFLTPDAFQEKISQGAFYEYAKVYQHHYGTLKSEIHQGLDTGLDLLLNIDVQGAATFRQAAAKEERLGERLVTVFITPPDLDVLRERLDQRGQNDESDLQHRLEVARVEMEQRSRYDYCIPSGSRDEDLEALVSVFIAEKLKTRHRNTPPAS